MNKARQILNEYQFFNYMKVLVSCLKITLFPLTYVKFGAFVIQLEAVSVKQYFVKLDKT